MEEEWPELLSELTNFERWDALIAENRKHSPWHWRWKWIKWIHNGQIREFERQMKLPPQPPITHFLGVRIATDDGKPLL